MIVASLFGTVLLAAVAADPMEASVDPGQVSAQQKNAATAPLVRSATDCIVHAVVADPRFGKQMAGKIGDLIVDSVPACVAPVRAMIDAYDHYYGAGAGEAFFMGPYLDVLPKAVTEGARKVAQ